MNFRICVGFLPLLVACTAPPEAVHLERTVAVPEVLAPSGPHAVGTVVHSWVDDSRSEGATEDPADFRQLIAQIWYPAVPGPGETFPFFPHLEAYRAAFGEDYPLSLGEIHSQSVVEARAAEGVFPVVLFFHGWNSQRSAYTGLLQEMASQGFVVVGIDQPYAGRVALPSGEVTPSRDDHFSSPQAMLEVYGGDAHFVLRQLAALHTAPGLLQGRLDLDRVAAVGHSNGAISAVQVSHTEPRIRGAVLLDSFDRDVEPLFLLEQPLLLVRTGGAKAPSASYRDALTAVVYDLEIAGGSHRSALDRAYLEAPDGERAAAETLARRIRTAVVAFLDGVLRGDSNAALGMIDQASEGATLSVLRPGPGSG
jgi:pimeloyl-ACP methyl ester carboxylesterase